MKKIIYLFVDDFEFNDWKILVEDKSEMKLLIEENFVVEISNN